MRTLVLTACLLALSTAAAADKDKVYKWVDDKGVVHYENKPHDESSQPAKLPPLQTYKGTPPDISKLAAPAAPGQPGATAGRIVNILSPAAEETFRDADRTVAVAVEVPGGLGGGQLVYYLDGAKKGGPTSGTTLSLGEVERGSHTLTVALLDNEGKEVARSAPVTFHMKPPTAKQK